MTEPAVLALIEALGVVMEGERDRRRALEAEVADLRGEVARLAYRGPSAAAERLLAVLAVLPWPELQDEFDPADLRAATGEYPDLGAALRAFGDDPGNVRIGKALTALVNAKSEAARVRVETTRRFQNAWRYRLAPVGEAAR